MGDCPSGSSSHPTRLPPPREVAQLFKLCLEQVTNLFHQVARGLGVAVGLPPRLKLWPNTQQTRARIVGQPQQVKRPTAVATCEELLTNGAGGGSDKELGCVGDSR